MAVFKYVICCAGSQFRFKLFNLFSKVFVLFNNITKAFKHVIWVCFKHSTNFFKCCFLTLVMFKSTFACKGFNTSYTSCDTCLGKDLKISNGTGISYMSTAAKFCGEISHLYNTYLFTILFSKQRHSTCFLCFI